MIQKKRHIRIRFYPPFLYFLLENWLKKMSLNGWHLINRRIGIIYCFEIGEPEIKEYFAWDPSYTGEGKYSIPMRYPSIKKTYGVKAKYSILNRSKYLNIIEVDTCKIDVSNDLSYLELKNDRNKLYILRFLRNLLIITIPILIFLVISFLIF